jgi:hypothetical protein
MLGGNAIRGLGLDASKVRLIADEVGPRLDEISEELRENPLGSELSLGFREIGSFS